MITFTKIKQIIEVNTKYRGQPHTHTPILGPFGPLFLNLMNTDNYYRPKNRVGRVEGLKNGKHEHTAHRSTALPLNVLGS